MQKTSLGSYLFAYLLWVVTLILALLTAAVILDTSLAAMVVADWHRYPTHAVRQFLLLIMGITLVALLVFYEHYYRTGAERQRLLERFARMSGIFILVMAFCHGIHGLFSIIFGAPSWVRIGGALIELLVGVGSLWYARRAKDERMQRIKGRM